MAVRLVLWGRVGCFQASPVVGWSGGQGGKLDELLLEDAVSDPGRVAGEAVDAGAGEAEVAFGPSDRSFAAGAARGPCVGGSAVFVLPPCRAGSAFAGQRDEADPGGAQLVFDGGFSVAAIGGDRSW